MATINSLLFLFSTLAPNIEPPGNIIEWPHVENPVSYYRQDAVFPVLTQTACSHTLEHPSCKSHCQKDCSNYDQDIPCPDICVFGCTCMDSLVRGPDGSCIPSTQCPSTSNTPVSTDATDETDTIQCESDEEMSSFAHCPRNCTNVGEIIMCDGEGPRGCRCKQPKVKGPDGTCIMPDQCPKNLRNPQAVFPVLTQTACSHTLEHPSCKSHCQKDCSNYDQDIPCPDICVFGCTCMDSLVRGPDGSCIPSTQCPSTPNTPVTTDTTDTVQCESDEEVSPFAHCQRNCSNVGEVIMCDGEGPRGCVCKSPKIRGPEGTCILSEQCPKNLHKPQGLPLSQTACQRTMEYPSCQYHCQKNCTNYGQDIPCPDICVFGCVCIDPFIRASDGSCIMPYECPATPETPVTEETTDETDNIPCASDEELSVYAHCQRNCSNVGQIIMCDGEGPRGCMCKSPKIRGPDGSCILSDKCPRMLIRPRVPPMLTQTACDKMQHPSCQFHCQKTCTNYDQDIPCPDICVFGCACIDPFIRGPDGSCIMPYECPATPDAPVTEDPTDKSDDIQCESDEEMSTYAHCQRNCSNVGQFIYCDGEGPQGCMCKSPMVRGPEGACIMPNQCPIFPHSPQDLQCEDSEECDNTNDEDNENEVYLKAFPGAFDNFKHCEDENEVYKICSSRCPDNCENYQDTHRQCNVICWPLPKCECKEGYVRGREGYCIKPELCNQQETTTQGCPEDEEYRECGTACQKNCQNYDDNTPCTAECESGCFCREPMVRGPDGKCIQQEECPPTINKLRTSGEDCPESEEYRECGTACQETCQNYDKNIPCEFKCESGCFCREPMVRGPDGRCIEKEQCPARSNDSRFSAEDCPENEEYRECGTACQETCQNYDENIPCEFKCESGCFCKEPMVRGPDGRCVEKEQCPRRSDESRQPPRHPNSRFLHNFPKVTCKENEEFSFCAPLCPDDCTNFKEDRLCKRICVPGCKCMDGYVKGKEGNCTEIHDCEKEKNDCSVLEEYAECGSYCEIDCYNHNATDRQCEDNRCRQGCFCKSGLVRGPSGLCIQPEKCPEQNKPSWSMRILKFRRGRS